MTCFKLNQNQYKENSCYNVQSLFNGIYQTISLMFLNVALPFNLSATLDLIKTKHLHLSVHFITMGLHPDLHTTVLNSRLLHSL